MVISKPAAVDKAAATPPAATRAITQKGSLAISGFAKTIISLSIYTSFLLVKSGLFITTLSPEFPFSSV